MSVDRSLKVKGALSRHRNVLSRAERVELLKDEDRWAEGDAVTGLPKVAHRKSHSGTRVLKTCVTNTFNFDSLLMFRHMYFDGS